MLRIEGLQQTSEKQRRVMFRLFSAINNRKAACKLRSSYILCYRWSKDTTAAA